MGKLSIQAAECKYKENVGGMEEKFNNGINAVTSEIKELTTIKEHVIIQVDKVPFWAKR